MIPTKRNQITDDPEELKTSVRLAQIAAGLGLLLIGNLIFISNMTEPNPVTYIVTVMGLIVLIGILWRGYLAWSKLNLQ